MIALTPRQRQAYDLRQSGKKLAEIAAIMGTTREPVRQWIAAAEKKLARPIDINATLPPETFAQILTGEKRMISHKRNPRIDRYFDAKTPERAVINDRKTTIFRRITRIIKTKTEYRIHFGIDEKEIR